MATSRLPLRRCFLEKRKDFAERLFLVGPDRALVEIFPLPSRVLRSRITGGVLIYPPQRRITSRSSQGPNLHEAGKQAQQA